MRLTGSTLAEDTATPRLIAGLKNCRLSSSGAESQGVRAGLGSAPVGICALAPGKEVWVSRFEGPGPPVLHCRSVAEPATRVRSSSQAYDSDPYPVRPTLALSRPRSYKGGCTVGGERFQHSEYKNHTRTTFFSSLPFLLHRLIQSPERPRGEGQGRAARSQVTECSKLRAHRYAP